MKLKKLGYILLSCFITTSANAVVLNLDSSNGIVSGWADRSNDFAIFGGALPKGCGLGECYQESGYYIGTAAADGVPIPDAAALMI